jgi:hypothetical protein
MKTRLKLAAALAAVLVIAGCATAAGGLVGAGIGRASGDTTTGVLIGSGIGMMFDIMD